MVKTLLLLSIQTYGSKDLGWEKSYNWNVGLDYGILNNRVDGSIEWFKTTTKGLLFKRTLPITSGLTGWGSPLSIWQTMRKEVNGMSELKNGFLTAKEVMDILQVKQSKAYQIIRQLNKELSGMGLITVLGRVDANYFKKKLFYEEK